MPDPTIGDQATFREHLLWIGRKATKLRRPSLDCGHANAGEVFFHALCDRLSCSDVCANAEHDCSTFGGAKSKDGTEEESAEGEAAVEEPDTTITDPLEAWATAMRDFLTPATVEAAVSRLACRGCRRVVLLPPAAKLCPACDAGPKCSAERSAAEWGGTVVCFRPPDHDGVHESVEGRAWTDAPNRVEAVRLDAEPSFTAIDETHVFATGGIVTAVPSHPSVTAPCDPWGDILAVHRRLSADNAYRPQSPPILTHRSAEVYNSEMQRLRAEAERLEGLSLECGMDNPLCSGCDGLARGTGQRPCQHECHVEPVLPHVDAAPEPDLNDPQWTTAHVARAIRERIADGSPVEGSVLNLRPVADPLKVAPAPRPWWKRMWSR